VTHARRYVEGVHSFCSRFDALRGTSVSKRAAATASIALGRCAPTKLGAACSQMRSAQCVPSRTQRSKLAASAAVLLQACARAAACQTQPSLLSHEGGTPRARSLTRRAFSSCAASWWVRQMPRLAGRPPQAAPLAHRPTRRIRAVSLPHSPRASRPSTLAIALLQSDEQTHVHTCLFSWVEGSLHRSPRLRVNHSYDIRRSLNVRQIDSQLFSNKAKRTGRDRVLR
jgi:hypothetical protein